jgi:hypothetical protein
MRVKLFGLWWIFKVFFPAERRIKWLPAVMWGYSKPKEKNT